MSSNLMKRGREVWSPDEVAPASAPFAKSRHLWAVVLTGGDGIRLQSLTLKISGDERPKQFCPIINEHSLLSQTRARLEPLFHPDRELFVVTCAHETYYREELSNVDDSCVLPQPLNRGTGVAVALAILHILQRDPDAVVVFAPCDHYYSDDDALRRAIKSMVSGAQRYPDSIVLLGAEADYPEVEYGWIERGSPVSHRPLSLMRVQRFWEKPSLPQAHALFRRGCLWNTFLTVGYANTFLDLLCSEVPNVVPSLNKALAEDELEGAYRLMPAVDLSRQVLTPQPHRLLAVRDTALGWADLGSPGRVMEILTRNNVEPPWLRDGHGVFDRSMTRSFSNESQKSEGSKAPLSFER